MSFTRESQLRTQTVHAVLTALGANQISTFGNSILDENSGTHLVTKDRIVQSTVWTDFVNGEKHQRNRYDVVVDIDVQVTPLPD